jgi:hypothetical protein
VLARELDTPLLGRSQRVGRTTAPAVGVYHRRAPSPRSRGAGVHDIVLLGAGTDMELRDWPNGWKRYRPRLSVRFPTTRSSRGGNGRRAGRYTHETERTFSRATGASAGDRARPGMRIRAFDIHTSLVDGQNGAGIALVSPSTLAKSTLDDVRHLLNATRSPLLGLITYDGSPSDPSARRNGTGRGSDGYRIARNGAVQVGTWAKGAGARLKSLQNRAPRS